MAGLGDGTHRYALGQQHGRILFLRPEKRARSDVVRYIEGFYNSRRRHSALGCRRPNEDRHGCQQPALAT